jgi:two-component system response regulator QseB
MAKIIVVEDNKDVAEQLRMLLTFEHHTVETAHDGKEASSALRVYDYDVIILDWDLPGMSGIDVLKEYRSHGGSAPILMLTGKDGTDDKERGLDSGADDYLTKPFQMKELAARVRALLRRPAAVKQNVLTAGPLELDPTKYRATRHGELVALVPKEFALLEFLMRNPNQVFNGEALLNRVWPSDSESTMEALRTTMKRLRKKIDPDNEIIKTVHGVGYVLESN